MSKELNLKSSTVEKALDLAKDFLGKIAGPSADEIGMLIADKIRFTRFKNQLDILVKAKAYAEKKNLKMKELPVKILVPLLENASLEEDEELQDKWAKMLTNMVDTDLNLQNHVFPYLLSQISIEEFDALKKFSDAEAQYLKDSEAMRPFINHSWVLLTTEQRELRKKIDLIEQSGVNILIEDYELANMVRLGIIKQAPPSIYIPELRIDETDLGNYHSIEAEYRTDEKGFRITELGERLLEICELNQ